MRTDLQGSQQIVFMFLSGLDQVREEILWRKGLEAKEPVNA